ncbi:hypothetical protein [Streptomyces sp. NPDC000133]|uniref:hypothetical protein n=1 Tax=Streptomyces sp. NPDC000133 TaxID=3364535 RepID=UPI0036AAFE01
MRRASGGLLCAVSSLLLGGVSHFLAGGRLPGTDWLTGAFVVLAAIGAALSGPRRRFDTTVLTMGFAQFVLHLVFHYASMPAMKQSMPQGPMSAHMNMSHDGGHAMYASMTVTHGVAALGVSACLVHGERLLGRLAALIMPTLLFWVAPVLVRASRPCLRGPLTVPIPHGLLLARGRPRRGPPWPVPA